MCSWKTMETDIDALMTDVAELQKSNPGAAR
jgi:hypothetical protein